jgi:serine/threonine-protein kinase HSL1, negative regulator of Swe1 kinase
MPSANADRANVTILRHASDASGLRIRHQAIERLQSSEPAVDGHGNTLNRNSVRSTTSKSSIASSKRSIGHSGPRRSTSYKRPVKFQHRRTRSSGDPARHSNPLPLPSSTDLYEEEDDDVSRFINEVTLPSDRYSSPALPTPPATVRSRKPLSMGLAAEVNVTRARPSSQYWKDEARKVSTELEKFCEEAFNRSSKLGSQTKEHTRDPGTDTPPGTAAAYEKSVKAKESAIFSRMENNPKARPLPAPPIDQLDSFTIRQLAETRSRLIDASLQRGDDGLPDYLSNVINHLDRLLHSELLLPVEGDGSTRASSDPHPHSGVEPGYLPAITEEGFPSSQDNLNWTAAQGNDQPRAISDPTPSASTRPPARLDYRPEQTTIRLVPSEAANSPMEMIKPLQIRKTSDGPPSNSAQRSQSGYYNVARRNAQGSNNEESVAPYYGDPEARDSGFVRFYPLVPIQEEDGSPKRKSGPRQSGDSRKWSNIFKRSAQTLDDVPPTPPMKDAKPLEKTRARESSGSSSEKKRNSGTKSDKSDLGSHKETGKTKKFFKFFTKTKDFEKGKALGLALSSKYRESGLLLLLTTNLAREDDMDDISTLAAESTACLGRETSLAPRATQQPQRMIEVNQNWFARFFHVKPATRVLCLSISKIRARREIFRVLKEWKRYGMKDVHVDRAKGLLFGRVDAVNSMDLVFIYMIFS